MSAAHTPGPWRATCRDMNYQDGAEWPEDEFLQWEVEGPRIPSGRGEFFQADARLIAAAPELLEALATLTDHCRRMGFDTREEEPLLQAAEAAIAKATGEQA